MAVDNKSLGRFILDGIPPAPRGTPQIEVTFDIDSNGILHVSAKDKNTNKEQKITIANATNLSDEEVEKMKAEAEKHAEEDKRKREGVEARNQAYSVASEIKKQLGEYGDKLAAEDKAKIEEAVKKLEELSQDEAAAPATIQQAIQDTYTAAQKIGEVMQAQGAGATSGPNPAEPTTAENPNAGTAQNNSDSKGKDQAEEGEVVSE